MPPKKKAKETPPKRDSSGVLATAAAAAATEPPHRPSKRVVAASVRQAPDDQPEEPSQDGGSGLSLSSSDKVIFELSQGSARVPLKTPVAEMHRQAGTIEQMKSVFNREDNPVLLMLSDKNPQRPYVDHNGTQVTVFVDLGRQLPSNRLGKVFINFEGVIESIETRQGDTKPTMRFRLDPDDFERYEQLANGIGASLSTPGARSRLQKCLKSLDVKHRRRAKSDLTSISVDVRDTIWCESPSHRCVRRASRYRTEPALTAVGADSWHTIRCELPLQVQPVLCG
jgi:hypothetical protein